MANLQLKWGLYTNLPKTINKNDVGTIFVTKDEGGLYLGVTENQAPLRLQSQVQSYADVQSFVDSVAPPYSPDVIYYIASKNKLYRYDPKKYPDNPADEQGGFIELNVNENEHTKLKNDIAKLQNDLEQTSAKANQVDGLTTRVSDLETEKGKLQAEDKRLSEAIEALESLITGESGGVGGGATISDQLKELQNWKTTASDNLQQINNTLATTATKEQINDLDELIDKNASDISDIKSWQAEQESAHSTMNENIDKNANAVQQLSQKFDSYYDKTYVDTLEAGVYSVIDDILDNRVTQTETDINDIVGWKNTTAQPALDKIPGLENDIQLLQNAVSNTYTKTEIDGAHAAITSAIGGVEGKADAAQEEVDTLKAWKTTVDADLLGKAGAIEDLNDKFDDYYTIDEVDELYTDLESYLADELIAANALKFEGTITSEDSFHNMYNEGKLPSGIPAKIGSMLVVNSSTPLTLTINRSTEKTVVAHTGDILIASGVEDADGNIKVDKLRWNHIETGYYKSHEGVLRSQKNTVKDNSVDISLTSLNGAAGTTVGDLGKITLTTSNNLVIKGSDAISGDGTISFELQWMSFDPTTTPSEAQVEEE